MSADPHKQAAVGYLGIGLLVIVITFLGDLVPASRAGAELELAIGGAFIVVFALLIYRGWWPISGALSLSNAWRTLTYFNDGRGVHVQLLPYRVIRIEPQPLAFVNAGLMLIIVGLLLRSAIRGLANRRQQRAA